MCEIDIEALGAKKRKRPLIFNKENIISYNYHHNELLLDKEIKLIKYYGTLN